jgi:hypothetical protein
VSDALSMVAAAPPVAPGLTGPFLSAVAAAIDSLVVGPPGS